MRRIFILITVVAGIFSVNLLAQTRLIQGVKNQLSQTRRSAMNQVPKVPQVTRVSPVRVSPNPLVIHRYTPTILKDKRYMSLLAWKQYETAFSTMSKDSTTLGVDYLELYFTMASDSLYHRFISKPSLETVADKFLEIEKPTPRRLVELLAIARQQFPEQRAINITHTPSGLLIDRVTTRYYKQILMADSTFTNQDAIKLCQLYDEYHQWMPNEGHILYYYLTGVYESAIPPLERYFKLFEDYPKLDEYIKRHTDEMAPRFRLLEKCYEVMGLTERRDSLVASPVYQQVINSKTSK